MDLRDEQGCKATHENYVCCKFNLTKHFQCRNLRVTKKTHARGAAQSWIRSTCLTMMRRQGSTFPSQTFRTMMTLGCYLQNNRQVHSVAKIGGGLHGRVVLIQHFPNVKNNLEYFYRDSAAPAVDSKPRR